jgi:hypothetical protein
LEERLVEFFLLLPSPWASAGLNSPFPSTLMKLRPRSLPLLIDYFLMVLPIKISGLLVKPSISKRILWLGQPKSWSYLNILFFLPLGNSWHIIFYTLLRPRSVQKW